MEYLLGLRENCKDLHRINFFNKIKLNDIILIKNASWPRPYCQLGRVIEPLPGGDNRIRSERRWGDANILNKTPISLRVISHPRLPPYYTRNGENLKEHPDDPYIYI